MAELITSSSQQGKYCCTLSADLLKKAEEELNEKGAWRDRDIQALRDMVSAHKGLKSRTDDAFLLRFLRARKFDYDRAYALLINYFSVRTQNPEVFRNLSFSGVELILSKGVVSVLPQRDKNGCNIIYFRPGKWDPSECPITDMMRAIIVTLEVLQLSEQTQVSGVVILENMQEVGLVHARNFDHKFAKLSTTVIQESFPMRLKGFHFVNEPAAFGAIFSIIKPFLKEKLVKRMNFHGSSIESLQKHFDLDKLPAELGGTLPSGDELAVAWAKEVRSHPEIFELFSKYTIELPNEITKTKSSETVECLTGTYRKLNVD